MTYRHIFLALLLACPPAAIASDAPMAHLFGYRPAPGQAQRFEDGYLEHLAWHRAHRDPLPWYAWTVADGPRAGLFIDGTFDIPLDGLDKRPDPAGDAADAQRTFLPYGTPSLRETWRRVSPASTSPLAHPERPLRIVIYTLKPGMAARFDVLVADMARVAPSPQPMAWFAPVSGTALNRRMLMVSMKDGTDELPAIDLESRIDALGNTRDAWRAALAETVTGTEAETWQPKIRLMLVSDAKHPDRE
jgi:hypothetical protein